MEKLATYVVKEGALSSRDAVGWIFRLSNTLVPIHGLGVAHGRVSAKAVIIDAPACHAQGYLLDAGDLADDPAYFSSRRCMGEGRTPADDTWATGVLLYRMLTGELPFPGVSAAAVADRISRAPPSPLAVFDVGDDNLQMILDAMFRADDAARLTDLAQLSHELLTWDRTLADLPALHFGSPDADDDDDDDEHELTQVRNLSDPPAAEAKAPYRLVTSGRSPWDPPAPAKPAKPPEPLETDSLEMPDSVDVVVDDVLLDEDTGLDLIDRGSAAKARPPPPPKRRPPPIDRSEPVIAVEIDADDSEPPPRARSAATEAAAVLQAQEPSASDDDSVASAAPRPRSRRTLTWLLLAAAVLGGAAFIRFGGLWPADSTPAGPATASGPATDSASGPTRPAATVSSSASAAAPASASASVAAPDKPAAPSTPEQMRECMAPLFAKGTFGPKTPDFAFVCTETSPHKASGLLRTEVVKAARGVNEGMREWANLGWYGMAVFGIARARCCASPPPLLSHTTLPQCELDARIDALGRAALGSDDAAAEKAYDDYNKAVGCLAHAGGAAAFGQSGMPRGGARTLFERTLARARKLAAR